MKKKKQNQTKQLSFTVPFVGGTLGALIPSLPSAIPTRVSAIGLWGWVQGWMWQARWRFHGCS